MGCFRIDLSSSLELIFYVLSLLQAYRAVQLAGRIGKDWSGFQQPPLTRQKMHLVEQSAFFLAIPPSVLVHELFHAIPIWLYGGRVVRCGYGFYWGFVQQNRLFLPDQEWIIKLGGTLGSLLFAAVLFTFLNWNKSRTLRYFGRQSLRTLLNYSLIYYPIFTAVTFIGDWRIIYDFGATPVLSGATAVVHAGLLLLFWQANRRGWFEIVGHQTEKEAATFAQLQADLQRNPHDARLVLLVAEAMADGGATGKATRLLQQAIRHNPNEAPLYVKLAVIQHGGKGRVPGTAVRNLEKALQLGLSDAYQRAAAHYLLAQFQLDKGQGQAALDHLAQAFSAAEGQTVTFNPLFKAKLYQLRSLAYQRLRQPDLAYEAAQQAVAVAQETGNEQAVAYYQGKLKLIEDWNGRRS